MKRFKVGFFVVLMAALFLCLPAIRVYAEADKTALSAAYGHIQTAFADEPMYHAASFSAFEADYAALGGNAAVEALIADPLAPQEAVDEKTAALNDILGHLTLHQTYVRINALFWTTQAENRSSYTLRSRIVYDAELARLEAILANPRSGETAILGIEIALQDAQALLDLLADRIALQAEWDRIQSIRIDDELRYTPNSFALFETAVDQFSTSLLGATGKTAFQILEDTDANVAEAQLVVEALEDAEDHLVLRVDMTALFAGLEVAEKSDLSGFTPASIQVFLNELAFIRAMAEDLNATQAEADQAILDLLASFTLLVELADKSILIANHAAVLVAFYETRHEYTPTSYDVFKSAVFAYGHYFAAEAVIADLNASQTEVDQLALAMEQALALLVKRADASIALGLLAGLRTMDLTPYTPSSIAAFEALLLYAQTVLNDSNTDQATADPIAADLLEAQTLLVLRADKTALQASIEGSLSVNRTRFSASSMQTLDLWIGLAQTLLLNADATQTEVDAMRANLDTIRTSLKRKTELPSIRANSQTLSLNDYVFVFEASIAAYASSDPTVLAIGPNGVARGLRFGRSKVTITLTNGVIEEFDVLVRADVKPATIMLAALIPLVPGIIVYALVFFKPSHFVFLKKIAFWGRKR